MSVHCSLSATTPSLARACILGPCCSHVFLSSRPTLPSLERRRLAERQDSAAFPRYAGSRLVWKQQSGKEVCLCSQLSSSPLPASSPSEFQLYHQVFQAQLHSTIASQFASTAPAATCLLGLRNARWPTRTAHNAASQQYARVNIQTYHIFPTSRRPVPRHSHSSGFHHSTRWPTIAISSPGLIALYNCHHLLPWQPP